MNRNAHVDILATCFALAALVMPHVTAQNCGCAAGLCCSQYGYCGTGRNYCRPGCKASPRDSAAAPPATNGDVVGNIVTSAFFNGIINQAATSCAGKRFYSRQAFLDALDKWAYCDHNVTQYPCKPSKKYFGRGPLQITWNYNYGLAGKSIGFDGLNSPETIANNPFIAFKTSLWFWRTNSLQSKLSGQGFNTTIRAINGGECSGKKPKAVQARVTYYTNYYRQFGVALGRNLYC